MVGVGGDPADSAGSSRVYFAPKEICASQHDRYMGFAAYMSIKFVQCNKKFSALHPKDRINDLFKDSDYDATGSAKGTTPEERVAPLGDPL